MLAKIDGINARRGEACFVRRVFVTHRRHRLEIDLSDGAQGNGSLNVVDTSTSVRHYHHRASAILWACGTQVKR